MNELILYYNSFLQANEGYTINILNIQFNNLMNLDVISKAGEKMENVISNLLLKKDEIEFISFNEDIFYCLFQNEIIHRIQVIDYFHVAEFIKLLIENQFNFHLLSKYYNIIY